MANRINANIEWVRRQLELRGKTDVLQSEILEALNDAEDELARESGAIRSETVTVELDGSAEVFDLAPLAVVEQVRFPSTWSVSPVVTTDLKEYERVRSEYDSGDVPRILMIRAGQVHVWPVGTSGDEIVFIGSTTPETAQVEGSGDPVLPALWDRAMRYSALAYCTGDPADFQRYEDEKQSTTHHVMVADGPVRVGKQAVKTLGF